MLLEGTSKQARDGFRTEPVLGFGTAAAPLMLTSQRGRAHEGITCPCSWRQSWDPTQVPQWP